MTEEGDGEASRRNEPVARVKGMIARKLIENNKVESCSFEPAERSGSEEIERKRSYRLEKRPRREDTDVDQKLEKLKEQLLMELEARDNSGHLLPTQADSIGYNTEAVHDAKNEYRLHYIFYPIYGNTISICWKIKK